MLSLLVLAALQSTDFGVRQPGVPVPVSRQKAVVKRSTSASSFTCDVATITDGDTLRCADGTRVRLAGIDAPEVSPCSPRRRCVSGDGFASRRSLADLASARTLRCEAVGTSYKRIVALRRLRAHLGITQRQLADLAELSDVSICHYETGATISQKGTMERLAKALGTTASFLREGVAAYQGVQIDDATRRRLNEVVALSRGLIARTAGVPEDSVIIRIRPPS